jgi:hypothetical protein
VTAVPPILILVTDTPEPTPNDDRSYVRPTDIPTMPPVLLPVSGDEGIRWDIAALTFGAVLLLVTVLRGIGGSDD